jgi:hypothetical protein
MSVGETEAVERRLSEAGYPTMRLRQQANVSVYAVLAGTPATRDEADALVRTLRQQGFADAEIVGGDDRPLAVRVGPPRPLRGAVSVAERVRAFGHAVRVASQPGEAVSFVVRHGSYPSREEAGEKRAELNRLGLATEVVRIR